MNNAFLSQSRMYLYGALLLLLVAALYYRVAHPSLEYHTDHTPVASGQQTQAGQDDPNHDHPPLSDADNAELGKKMAALRENPTSMELLLSIAELFQRNKDWINAIAFYERAAGAAPDDMRPHYFLGMAHTARSDFPKAEAAFSKALALAPDNASIAYSLGVLYRYHMSQPAKATAMFTRVAESPYAAEGLRQKAREELARGS